MFAGVAVMYMNYFDKLKSNLSLKTTYKPATVAYYKRSTSKHNTGDIKEVTYNKHWTPLGKLVKALVFCNEENLALQSELQAQYEHYIKKFGERRIWNLVEDVKSNLLKKIHKIEFKTGTWRCCHSSNRKTIDADLFVDETNALYKYWMKVSLRKEFGDIYVPLQINNSYHNLAKS